MRVAPLHSAAGGRSGAGGTSQKPPPPMLRAAGDPMLTVVVCHLGLGHGCLSQHGWGRVARHKSRFPALLGAWGGDLCAGWEGACPAAVRLPHPHDSTAFSSSFSDAKSLAEMLIRWVLRTAPLGTPPTCRLASLLLRTEWVHSWRAATGRGWGGGGSHSCQGPSPLVLHPLPPLPLDWAAFLMRSRSWCSPCPGPQEPLQGLEGSSGGAVPALPWA